MRVAGQIQPDSRSVPNPRALDFNTEPTRPDHACRRRHERFGVLARAAVADEVRDRGMSGNSRHLVRILPMSPAGPKRLKHARIVPLELQLKGGMRLHLEQDPASEHIAVTHLGNAPDKVLLALPLAGNADHRLGICLALAHPVLAHVALNIAVSRAITI